MGTLLKDRMALLKGHLSLEEATNWPESPEQATEQYCSFFGKWFALGAPSKPEIRLACSEAWPKLSSQSLKGLVNGLQECRTHLRRKWKNMKTGDRTSKELRDLMQNIFGQAGSSSRKIAGSDKPEKAAPVLPTKRASKLAKATPETVAEALSDEAKPALEKEKLAKAMAPRSQGLIIQRAAGSESEGTEASEAMTENCDVISVSSVASISASQLKAKTSKEDLKKKPACKPSKALKRPCKPAKAVKKRPAKSLEVATVSHWVQSQSFGWMKATYASKKAYIVSKLEKAGKPSCLVNVSMEKGEKQSLLVQKLLSKAAEAGLSKEDIVQYKNDLLQEA